MAYSVFQNPMGVDWPLGFVAVPTIGTPVNIMSNVDPGNNNAPGSGPGQWGVSANKAEYTPTCRKVTLQGMKPNTGNNGMIPNAGYVYVLRSSGPNNQNSGGNANRTDPGAMVYILPPGGSVVISVPEMDGPGISPYWYSIDADANNDGALVTLLNCGRG